MSTSQTTFTVHFDDELEPDLSWLPSDEDPADFLTLVAWVTTTCSCCGQECIVASLGNVTVPSSTYIAGDRWAEDEVPSISDAYLREVAESLLLEARDGAK